MDQENISVSSSLVIHEIRCLT